MESGEEKGADFEGVDKPHGNTPSQTPRSVPHILIVDDSLRLRRLLKRYLEENGFRVTLADGAESATRKMRGIWFDALILDVMMPGKTGLEFARELNQNHAPPLLMLTALSEAEHRIEGLEAGVEDYLTKPFEPRELLLRLRRILRRDGEGKEAAPLRLGACIFDPNSGRLTREGAPVPLHGSEQRLLEALLSAPGEVFSREALTLGEGAAGSPAAVAAPLRVAAPWMCASTVFAKRLKQTRATPPACKRCAAADMF